MITFDHAVNAPFKIKRATGNVIVDDKIIGTVAKIEDVWGTDVWQATDAAGHKIRRTYRTAREAAQTLARLTAAPTVTNIDVFDEPTYFGGPTGRTFVAASVTWQGKRYGVSRYAGEDFWTVDSFTAATAVMSTWCNGPGTRVTLRHPLESEIAALVDAAVCAARFKIIDGTWVCED